MRTAQVHLEADELAQARPHLIGRAKGVTLSTEQEPAVDVGRSLVLAWAADDGTTWKLDRQETFYQIASTPLIHVPAFNPMRGGTWTLRIQDDTTATKAGKYMTITGGFLTASALATFVFTAALIGPQPSFDYPTVLRAEAIAIAACAGVATIGSMLWLFGNVAFRARRPDLGEGVFRF